MATITTDQQYNKIIERKRRRAVLADKFSAMVHDGQDPRPDPEWCEFASLAPDAATSIIDRYEIFAREKQLRELIVECTAPLERNEGMPTVGQRTNRLLAAI